VFGLFDDVYYIPGLSKKPYNKYVYDEVLPEIDQMVFPAKPQTSRALIEATGASHRSDAKKIISADDVFEGFFSVTTKWRYGDAFSKDNRKWDLTVGTLLSDACHQMILSNASDPWLWARRCRDSWRFVYQPGGRPDWVNNNHEIWQRTGEFNFVRNKNLCGQVVPISNGLKSGEDNIMCVSLARVELKDALHYLFLHGYVAADCNGVRLEDVGIVTALEIHYEAYFKINAAEGHDAELFFHIDPNHEKHKWKPSPWGHLSRSRVCIGDPECCIMTSTSDEEAVIGNMPDFYDFYDTVHRQEMDGVRMYLCQSCSGCIHSLSRNDAAVSRWARETWGSELQYT